MDAMHLVLFPLKLWKKSNLNKLRPFLSFFRPLFLPHNLRWRNLICLTGS